MEPCVVKRLRKGNVGQSNARLLKGLTCPFFQGGGEGGCQVPLGCTDA